ncbi:hypothetical protein D7V93_07875 [Corallococcus llansteffanensis]|uniref:Uncharacterized protein n=1 Tax=Corallococcus llansteffanensis TaxID=2316731 RepID=A0A3A8Q936_9BACT|nr:hypothetical protein D7V93_07875 [Corallococcus llansteffanensis]
MERVSALVVEQLHLLLGVGVGNLCVPVAEVGPGYSRRMVDLLIDGLRYGAPAAAPPAARPARPSTTTP